MVEHVYQIECESVTAYERLEYPWWPSKRRFSKHARMELTDKVRSWWGRRRWVRYESVSTHASCSCGEWQYGRAPGKTPEMCEKRFQEHLREVGALT